MIEDSDERQQRLARNEHVFRVANQNIAASADGQTSLRP